MFPALEGVEPVAAYAGLRPAGRDTNYAIGPSKTCQGLLNVAAIRSTGLSASLGIAEHVLGLIEAQGVELGPDRPLRGSAARPTGPGGFARPAIEGSPREAPAARNRRRHHRRQGRALRRAPAARARGSARQGDRYPRPGWVEQDGEEVLARVVDAVAELLDDAPGEVVACGLDHQGESVLAWDAESGAPLTPIVVWQDKRSQEVLDRLGRARGGGPARAAGSVRPLLLGGQARVAARARRGRGASARGRHAAHGHRRLVPLRPPRRGLCDRCLHRLAHPAPRARRRPASTRTCAIFRRARRGVAACRDSVGELGVLRHPSWPVELPLTGAGRGPAGRAGGRGVCRAGAGEGHLRHRRLRARPRGHSRCRTAGGLLPTVAWSIDGRMEYALDGGVFAGGSDARVAVQRARPGRRPPGPEPARERGRRLGGCPRAACAGRHRRALVAPRCAGGAGRDPPGPTRANVARAALEGIAWRVADIVAAIRETVDVDVLRVDGGLTNEPLMLELQADTTARPWRRRERTRRCWAPPRWPPSEPA